MKTVICEHADKCLGNFRGVHCVEHEEFMNCSDHAVWCGCGNKMSKCVEVTK